MGIHSSASRLPGAFSLGVSFSSGVYASFPISCCTAGAFTGALDRPAAAAGCRGCVLVFSDSCSAASEGRR